MKKNDPFYIKAAYVVCVSLFVSLLALAGCEDPGPSGQTLLYENRVEVHTLATAPSMTNPNDEIWDDVPITVIFLGKDPAEFLNDLTSQTLNISAIKHNDRLYLRTLWSTDAYHDVSPGVSTFSREYFFPVVDTSLRFTVGPLDDDTLQDTIIIKNFGLNEVKLSANFRTDSLETPDTLSVTICTPTGTNDTVIVSPTEWQVTPEFTCTTTVHERIWTQKDEDWTRASQFSLLQTPTGDTVFKDDGSIETVYYFYSNSERDQDRIAIMWDMGNNGSEGANCMTMCHAVGNESTQGHRMYTSQGGTVDVWHWQSALSNPVLLAVDEIWTDSGRTLDEQVTPIYEMNWDTVTSQPLYQHMDDTGYTGSFLLVSEAVPFEPDSPDDTIDFWPHSFKIPGYTVNEVATGSGADISSFSWHTSQANWYVLLNRALSTGNADDVDLSTISAGDSIMTSIAVMDNASSIHYITEEPVYFIFK